MKYLSILLLVLTTACASAPDNTFKSSISVHEKATSMFSRMNSYKQPTASVRGSKVALLRSVNKYVNNRINYVNDTGDYWQAPHETERLKSGDCEDYAIYKMHLLSLKGVLERDMSIVVGYLRTGEAHAVLRVKMAGNVYYLDNRDSHIKGNPMDTSLYMINKFNYSIFMRD